MDISSGLFYGAGSLGSLYRSGAAHANAAEAKEVARRAGSDTLALQREVDRLSMAVEALWSILKEKTGVTDDELRDRIREIDLSDGVLDGKVRRPPRDCTACGRTIASRHVKCIYCGAEVEAPPLG